MPVNCIQFLGLCVFGAQNIEILNKTRVGIKVKFGNAAIERGEGGKFTSLRLVFQS